MRAGKNNLGINRTRRQFSSERMMTELHQQSPAIYNVDGVKLSEIERILSHERHSKISRTAPNSYSSAHPIMTMKRMRKDELFLLVDI